MLEVDKRQILTLDDHRKQLSAKFEERLVGLGSGP